MSADFRRCQKMTREQLAKARRLASEWEAVIDSARSVTGCDFPVSGRNARPLRNQSCSATLRGT